MLRRQGEWTLWPVAAPPRATNNRATSLARQRGFSDGSMTRWDFLVALREDVAHQGRQLAAEARGRATVADRPTILARLAADQRRIGELLKDITGGGMAATPDLTPAEVGALFRLVVRLYDLADAGLREAADAVAAEGDPAWSDGVAREAEIVRATIAGDPKVWPLVAGAVRPVTGGA